MTARKHLKQLVRARMEKTGESYAAARRRIIRDDRPAAADPAARAHFPGNVPAATALRVLLAHAGVRDPRTGQPFSEAMVFGIAGGIGIGIFAFHYEKEDWSSFFIGGRHKWADDLDYLTTALGLFGIPPVVRESSGAGPAARQLSEALEAHGPCVAWVDMAHLPHRALPESYSGGGYHVVVVYRIEGEVALVGDLTDDPIPVPLPYLAAARARIRKQKHRLLSAALPGGAADLRTLIRRGLENGRRELLEPSMKGARRNFQLDAIRVWGERLHGGTDREGWERVFRRGGPLWRGLTSVYDCIEHYGTGGGLCRPLFADFLREASETEPRLAPLAEQYGALGQEWSALAHAALPDDIPLLRESRETLARKAELGASGGTPAEIRRAWDRLTELEAQAGEAFPLSDTECGELRAGLKRRVLALHAAEEAALQASGEVLGRLA